MIKSLPIIGLALVTVWHFGYVRYLKITHEAAIEATKAECVKNQQITQRFTKGTYETINHLHGRIDELKRVRPKACVSPPRPACNPDATTQGEHGGQNGVDTDTFLDYARDCEELGIKLDVFQEYMRELHK